jgi:predicted acetylornithine/succinylornithine family transaminase
MEIETLEKLSAGGIQALEARHVLQTYKRAPIAFVRGHGVRLYDTEGREYLDLLSGIGVASLGHAHAGLARAVAEQAQTLIHTSNLFYHPFQGQLAERLSRLSGLSRVFFCNSGTEAVEACLKFARRYWHTRGESRAEFIALENSFHGRTFGALSVTANEHYRSPFEPLVPGVRFVPANDSKALLAAVSQSTAAIIAEPVQGEGGVRPLTAEFAVAMTEAASRTGALIVADEVQSGLGRTGHPFYAPVLGLQPDLISIGKALGGGIAVGAALVSQKVADAVAPGDHGSTYGGNLLACRAALCFLDELEAGGLLGHVARVGEHLERQIREMTARYPVITEVRGAGLMWGLQLSIDAAPVVQEALARGVIVNRTAETVVRLLPALVITETEIDEALGRLDAAFAAAGDRA